MSSASTLFPDRFNTSARNASRRATENWKWDRVVAAAADVAAEVAAASDVGAA